MVLQINELIERFVSLPKTTLISTKKNKRRLASCTTSNVYVNLFKERLLLALHQGCFSKADAKVCFFMIPSK